MSGSWWIVGVVIVLIVAALASTVADAAPRMRAFRRMARERAGRTMRELVEELGRSGVEPAITGALYREFGDIVRLYEGIERFPAVADDDLRRMYRLSTELYTGWPDDPDFAGLARHVAGACSRRFPQDHDDVYDAMLECRTVRDLAMWVQGLPAMAIEQPTECGEGCSDDPR